ncbi:MAG: ABC transporter substrate-binding protein [Zoogloea sp.]|jgi:NitT/TauT family transport system substrate-binding protein|uniref:ABC transporter substrate-binding protein n=1 Tax=Zoogloea sp. TaxID=49181 RepID=UPI0026253118|nr:ABC transporter substrate-binding protein [Zoogloea sp.]MDD3327359.1 ABC transporter substrate-binding protein [Zoogloea sp.]
MPSLRRRAISLGLGGSLLLTAAGCNRSSREPIKFATNPWPGYDPLYVARDKGYFDEVGLDVTLVDLTSLGASRRAFERGQVDGCGATLVEILLTADQSGTRPQIAAVVDYSNGADVLVGEPGMASPADLRERRVAIEPGTLHIQLLALALASVKLSVRDVILVPMPQNAMPGAFAEGLVSAAVCFPPESNRILEAGGKVLFHSGQVPGQVVDTLVFDSAFVSRRGPDVPAFVAAYYKAVGLMASHPDEAHAIMARRENMSVDELRQTMSGIHFVSRTEQPALLAPGGPVERSLDELQGAMMALAQLRQVRNLKDFLIAREFLAGEGGVLT